MCSSLILATSMSRIFREAGITTQNSPQALTRSSGSTRKVAATKSVPSSRDAVAAIFHRQSQRATIGCCTCGALKVDEFVAEDTCPGRFRMTRGQTKLRPLIDEAYHLSHPLPWRGGKTQLSTK